MRKTGCLTLSVLGWAAVGMIVLVACAPAGAKNWPFSIGPQTYASALGDLDGDGDLDAYLANGENEVAVPDTVWLNDGAGHFTNTGQQIGNFESHAVILSDLDLDGDLDALVSNVAGLTAYINKGTGLFDANARRLPVRQGNGSYVMAPAVGDANGDGAPDVFGGGCCGGVQMWDDGRRLVEVPHDALWLNDGRARFTLTDQTFDILGTSAIALGDLDGDGDLDAFFANSSSMIDQSQATDPNQADTLWFNDGQGRFTIGSQVLGASEATAVTLGDLDEDGDLDAVVGARPRDEIWINEGGVQDGEPGAFTQTGALVAGDSRSGDTRFVFLSDLDGDGDLDSMIAGARQARVWLNDGMAAFTPGEALAYQPQHAPALGDVDGDGDVDVFAGSINHGLLVWLNDGSGHFSRRPVQG